MLAVVRRAMGTDATKPISLHDHCNQRLRTQQIFHSLSQNTYSLLHTNNQIPSISKWCNEKIDQKLTNVKKGTNSTCRIWIREYLRWGVKCDFSMTLSYGITKPSLPYFLWFMVSPNLWSPKPASLSPAAVLMNPSPNNNNQHTTHCLDQLS